MKIRGCRLCTLGNCMCDRVTRWNNIRGINTPEDFEPGYRRKYLIRTFKFDPHDRSNADRYIEILHNWNLPGYIETNNGDQIPNPARRYGGDDGYRRFINDLNGTFHSGVA